MKKIKQLFCDHIFNLDILQTYTTVGDEYNKIPSGEIKLECRKCGKTISIIDKWYKNIDWLRNEKKDG